MGKLTNVKNNIIYFFTHSFIKSSIIYIIGTLLVGIIPLLLLPIFTRYLLPSDYGIVATSVVLVKLYSVIIGMETEGLIARTHYDNNHHHLKNLLSSSIILSILLTILLIIITSFFKEELYSLTKFPKDWAFINILIAFFIFIQGILFTMFQINEKPKRFILYQFIFGLINYTLAVFLIIEFDFDWKGRIIATFIAGFIGTTVSLYYLSRKLKLFFFTIKKNSINKLYSFGLPLIPHAIGGIVMTTAPLLYLNYLTSLSDTGLYSVGINIASIITFFIMAANKAYLPELFKRLSVKTVNQLKLSRILIIVTIILPLLGIAYGFSAKSLLPLIVGPKFYDAGNYVLWLSIAFSMRGIFFIYEKFIIYEKKTKLITWTTDFLGAISLIVFCPILISNNGPVGAAQATFIAFTLSALGCVIVVINNDPLHWKEAIKKRV
jgi:O-antigen/teichoic acid export membrane protein